jgi:hypothetical protein
MEGTKLDVAEGSIKELKPEMSRSWHYQYITNLRINDHRSVSDTQCLEVKYLL